MMVPIENGYSKFRIKKNRRKKPMYQKKKLRYGAVGTALMSAS